MKDEFADRLRQAFEAKGITQAELAEAIGTSQPAVSGFLRGQRAPSAETTRELARALGVATDWLLRGRKKDGVPVGALTNAASEVAWHFREAYGDGSQQYGNDRVEVLQASLEKFGREMEQNQIDASLGSEVVSSFRLGILSGDRLARFLRAIRWSELEPHYVALATDREHRATRRYREGLERFRRDRSLWVMRVDDYGTTGLIGDDFHKGPFTALVRKSQDSQKQDAASAGGRFGLGSSVLSSHSAFDLILFSSDLSEPVHGQTKGRLIGRTFLPFHALGAREFEGPSYFGVPDPTNPRATWSAWGNDELLDDLWLVREPQGTGIPHTGTSLLVVGFFDPMQSMKDQKPGEVLDELAEAIADNFWPAISTGRLRCNLALYDNDKIVNERNLDAESIKHPFTSLLANAGESLEDGRFKIADIPLRVPKSRDGDFEAHEHEARLIVELLDDTDSARTNHLAVWRKPHMVVKYKPFNNLTLGAKPFRAALVCGEATTTGVPTSAEIAAERFLARSEPPAHDDWTTQSTDLVSEYRGGGAALRAFDESVRETLRSLVAPTKSAEQNGPAELRELLSIPYEFVEVRKRLYTSYIDWEDSSLRDTISGSIRFNTPSRSGSARLRATLLSETETGGGVPVPCGIEATKNCTVHQGIIIPDNNVREISVRLRPNWGGTAVRPAFAALSLDLSIVSEGSGHVSKAL